MSLSLTERTAWTSLAVGLFVLSLKGVAWWITGSTAFFAEMLETVVNVAAASAALMAVRYSAMPADDNHPYGHAKAEYFSAVLEGALIVVAALVVDFAFAPPLWLHVVLWVPITVGAVVYGLRVGKAALLASEHQRKAAEGRLSDD